MLFLSFFLGNTPYLLPCLCYPDSSVPGLPVGSVQSAILFQKANIFSLLIQWGKGVCGVGRGGDYERTRWYQWDTKLLLERCFSHPSVSDAIPLIR